MAYNRTTTASRLTLLGKASSAMALATGLALGASGAAQAQVAPPVGAYEGTPTVASGSAFINRTTNTDTIQVDTNQAVINWTTNDTATGGAPINFLPNGRTAIYTNNPSVQNQFTVLNRIIPTDPSRAIALNGTIISQLQTGAGLVPGGNVWFYSPGGIVVGATGVIDVGGLLLTSADPVRDGAGNFIDASGSFTLGGATSPTSYVQIDPGALVQATPENSYIAMVAPIIRQNGTVDVNGSALMVGAEAATITFGTGGLFDIEVTTGTNGGPAGAFGEAIRHGGSTGGAASGGVGDNHRIYMVAVPKNNAITIAIASGSQLGFDVAGAADVDGNSIVLSSGYNVFGDSVDTASPVNGSQLSVMTMNGANDVTSAFYASTTNSTTVSADGGAMNFASDVELYGAVSATLRSNLVGGNIQVFGDVIVSSDNGAAVSGGPGAGGIAAIFAQDNGTLVIAGNALVSANGTGDDAVTGSAGLGIGGTADVRSFGNSLLRIDGNLTASAVGTAGTALAAGVGSANGTGGQIILTSGRNATVDNNSTIIIGGDLFATSNGFGSDSVGGTAGIGRGGGIQINSGSATGSVSSNNVLTIGGSVLSNADGFGGAAITGGTSGAGIGGNNAITAGIGGRINIIGDASLTAFGFGGSVESAGSGGAGTGGRAQALLIGAGGVIDFGADLVVQATGSGGIGLGTGSVGGLGRGGNASVSTGAVAGAITVQGFTQIDSIGLGGQGAQGGSGFGGLFASGGGAFVISNGPGTVTLNNGVGISAGGVGGEANLAGSGGSGNGTGGTAQIVATANGVINITGFTDMNANGAAFSSGLTGTDGGNGTGGNASISQGSGGQITITGDAVVRATGSGDLNQGGGDGIAGNGVGGDVRIAVNDRTITITGDATVDARGFGGDTIGGLRGGNGTGGIANLGAGAGTLSIGGSGSALANGTGGSSSTPGSGGSGFGGQAIIGSIPGGIIQIAGAADGAAQGFGGNASGTGNGGGLGDGGSAQIFANNGSVTVGGVSSLNSAAFGGSVANGASSGAALGGQTIVLSQGNGQVTLNQDVFLSAQALSGNVDSGAGNAAAATGGSVTINAFGAGGAITVNGSIFAEAIAGTGSAVTGMIADALGGSALIDSASGTVTVTGGVSLDATAFGGASTLTGNGGNATGGRTAVVIGGAGGATTNIGNALTMVANGFGGSAQTGNGGFGTGGLSEIGTINVAGSFTFGGPVSIGTTGTGGDVLLAGNGGTGTGGISRLGANGAQVAGGDLFLSASGRGGAGALGGAGGNAVGGQARLFAGSGAVTGLLDFNDVFLFADAFGGAGGFGATGAVGGAGGAGGNATAGTTIATAAAGNGQLDIDNVQITGNATAGIGGAGGVGTAGAGGNGGAGGNAVGAFNQFGVESGTGALTVNVGSARMLDAFVEANGFGGTGGAGGSGSTGAGNGGAGGSGEGGGNVLLVRGAQVEAGNLTLIADGFGGSGGAGVLQGAGGNGIGGGAAFAITDRFQIPANRGQLQAGNLLAIARGTGGGGSVGGLSLYGTGSNFEVRNADATIGNLVVNLSGDAPNPVGIVEDFVRITDGVANVAGSFTFTTSGQLSTLIDNGALNAGSVGLSAGAFVADTVITAPTNVGTITTDAISLLSGGDVLVTASLDAGQDVSISALGNVNLSNISGGGVISIEGSALNLGDLSSGNHINLISNSGGITAGTINASNFVAMTAANGLTVDVVTASTGYIDLLVLSGDAAVGNLNTGGFISVEAEAGSVAVGDLLSGEDIGLLGVGSVQFGNVSSQLDILVSSGGNIGGGNITALGAAPDTTYSIGLLSQGGSIAVGNLSAARNIGLVSPGTITAGSLSSGENVVALGIGDILLGGPVTAGTGATNFFYVGNASMTALLGPDFNPAPLFAATPVRTGGSLTVGGAIQAGNVLAGVGTALTVNGGITASSGRIGLTANSISAQNLSSTLFTSLNATAGNIAVGSVTAGGAVGLVANAGQITSGLITGATVGVDGQGPVSVGGVTATGAANMRSVASTFTATGAITAATVAIGGIGVALGNVTSTSGQIGIAAGSGNLSFGTMVSATNAQFSAGGSVIGGDVTAGTWMGSVVGGNLTLGNLRTTGPGTSPNGFSIGIGVTGTVVTGTIDSFGLLGIGSDDGQGNLGNAASITTGAINAGGSVFLRSNQGLTTGAIVSSNEIRVRGGSVTTGALTGSNTILAAAMTGSLNAGNVTSSTSALLLGAQSVSTGAISTGTTGTAFIGNSSIIPATGLISTIDLPNLLATTPVRVGGSASIGGPVTTSTLVSASSGGFSASGAITAGTRITLDAGGTAVFGGLAVAPTIAVRSADIAFSQNGGLGDANTSTLTLTNSDDGPMIIGGTTSSEGYLLDASEISRIRAGNITISAPSAGSNGVGIELRAFTLNGSTAASGINLNGSEGSLAFQTTSTIRVNGDAVFNAMAPTNRVALSAGRVEINADTGGVFLNGSSPGGVLSITANNVHIASASILEQLASNVNFAGRDAALGQPLATSRPDGVIQASRLQFNVRDTLLIQNTGTLTLDAGFFGRVGSVQITPSGSSSALLDMVIHGQLLDTGDIVRNGTSVRDLIFPPSSSTQDPGTGVQGFTATSSVNGCVINAAACVGASGGVDMEAPTTVVHAGPPPPEPAAEREAQREQDEAEAAAEEAARGEAAPRRPIMPPVNIVNTRRLGVESIITEPVTSGGNPNLQLDQPMPGAGGQP